MCNYGRYYALERNLACVCYTHDSRAVDALVLYLI